MVNTALPIWVGHIGKDEQIVSLGFGFFFDAKQKGVIEIVMFKGEDRFVCEDPDQFVFSASQNPCRRVGNISQLSDSS
ncbi:hypothetical protein SDC9_208109 [bioreactor metagenome]|uniref:Uncharacterized protein n=1 Tax=bioreactor metagenome TaxID=1076179 RepID=A0A645J9T7_9ZZZZ